MKSQKEWLKNRIEYLQSMYDNTPDTIIFEKVAIGGKLRGYKEVLARMNDLEERDEFAVQTRWTQGFGMIEITNGNYTANNKEIASRV